MIEDADHDQREGMHQQQQETGKQDNVKDAREKVARLLPLSQPKLENLFQSKQWSVKARIRIATKKRNQPLGHNIGKTSDAQKINEHEQDSVCYQPGYYLRG